MTQEQEDKIEFCEETWLTTNDLDEKYIFLGTKPIKNGVYWLPSQFGITAIFLRDYLYKDLVAELFPKIGEQPVLVNINYLRYNKTKL